MRFDLATTYLKFTGLASRQERPKDEISTYGDAFQALNHFADDSTLLLALIRQKSGDFS